MPETAADPSRSRFIRWTSGILIGLVLIAGALAPSDPQPASYRLPEDADLVSCLVALCLAVLLCARYRWPLAVFTVVLATTLVMTATGHSLFAYILALAVAAYEIARTGKRSRAIIVSIVAVTLVGLTLLITAHHDRQLLTFLGFVATIGFGGALGDAIQSRDSSRRSWGARIRLVEESRELEAQRRVAEERLRIARELHDAAAHQIAVINLQAGAASAALTAGRTADSQRALAAIRDSAQNVLGDISELLHMLRTAPDDQRAREEYGLADLPALCSDFEATGMRVQFDAVVPDGVPTAVAVVAYQVVQEALTNAFKHGSARRATVRLWTADGALHLSVTNPVAPGGPRTTPPGHGLIGMRERVLAVHGELYTGSDIDRFRVDAHLPLGSEGIPS